MNRRLALSVLGAASAALLCQCKAQVPRSLVVFAASSLREVFDSLGTAFEAARPGSNVTFHFAGSQELRTQLEHGAKADVFASADQRQLQALSGAQKLESAHIFAWNEPVLVVSRESADKIRVFSELPRAARIVIGAPEVPIGRYTLQLLDLAERKLGKRFRSAIEARVVSRELNVRQVLAKVSLGEADAGIVYRSDVPSARAVTLVAIPGELNVLAEYPIARLHASAEPELARDFVDLVLSPGGKSLLKRAGFRVDSGTTAVAP